MCSFKVRELSTDKIFTVLSISKEEGKTLFLVWTGKYFRWLDARKVEYVEEINWG